MAPGNNNVLIGWKEIAEYLGCSVATAIRRERDRLPVFRYGGQVRAFPDDVDKWLKGLRASDVNSVLKTESVEKVKEAEDVSAVLATLLRADNKEKIAVVRLGKDVAEFERIEIKLKSAEEKYRKLVEEIPEWVWEKNAVNEFIYSSPQVEEIVGYKPEDLTGFTAEEFLIHPDDENECRMAMNRLMERREVIHDLLCRFIHRDGSVRYMETSARPVFDWSGKPVGISGISRDVTERVRLEHEVTETRRYLYNVLQGSMDAIITTDVNGRVVTWNRGAEAIYGYTEDEAVGKNVDTLIDPPGWPRSSRDLYSTIEKKGGWYAEEPVEKRRKDGTILYASVSYSIVYGAEGEPAGVCGITRDITGRLRTEDALRESEAKYRELAELLPQPIFEMDVDGVFTYSNRSGLEIFGYSQDDLGNGTNVLRLFIPEERKRAERNIRKRLTGEEFEDHEYTMLRKDGTTFPALVYSAPIVRDNEPIGIRGIVLDITEQKNAEKELKASRDFLDRILNGIYEQVLVIDRDYKIREVNACFVEQYNSTREEVIGRTCHEITHRNPEPCHDRECLCPLEIVFDKGKSCKVEHVHKDNDGKDLIVEIDAFPLFGPDGEVECMVEIANDVTERKRAEGELREIEDKYIDLFNLLNDGIFIHDLEGNIIDVNKRVVDLFGYTREEILALNISDIHPPEAHKASRKAFEDVLRDGVTDFEIEFRKKNGQVFPAEVSSSLFEIGGKKVVHGIVRDITQRKRIEKALKDSEAMYHSVIETSNDAVISTDGDGRIISWNRAAERTFGYSEDEAIGKMVSLIIPERLNGKIKPGIKRASATQELNATGEIIETVGIRKDGNEIPVEHAVTMQETAGGVTFTAVIRDITERKRGEAALTESGR